MFRIYKLRNISRGSLNKVSEIQQINPYLAEQCDLNCKSIHLGFLFYGSFVRFDINRNFFPVPRVPINKTSLINMFPPDSLNPPLLHSLRKGNSEFRHGVHIFTQFIGILSRGAFFCAVATFYYKDFYFG